jgi:hypothetical protein
MKVAVSGITSGTPASRGLTNRGTKARRRRVYPGFHLDNKTPLLCPLRHRLPYPQNRSAQNPDFNNGKVNNADYQLLRNKFDTEYNVLITTLGEKL